MYKVNNINGMFLAQLSPYCENKSHYSAFKQALLDFLQFSPALYSAQWSFTSLTKSLRGSSKEKLYILVLQVAAITFNGSVLTL